MVLKKIVSLFNYVFFDIADRRSENYYLAKYPYWIIIIPVYLFFIRKLGPYLMQHQKPFNLTRIILLYNLFQVSLSLYMFIEMIYLFFKLEYSLKCQPIDFSESYWSNRVYNIGYVFYLAKLSELAETCFFIMRKKYSQASFLHLYHHATMIIVGWLGVRYIPGGNSAIVGIVNSFIHAVMYSYYLLAALGPQYHKYLWWKKYITKMQMMQFVVVTLHNAQSLLYNCGYPRWTSILYIPQAVFFYYLFNDFYKNAYTNRQSALKTADRSQ